MFPDSCPTHLAFRCAEYRQLGGMGHTGTWQLYDTALFPKYTSFSRNDPFSFYSLMHTQERAHVQPSIQLLYMDPFLLLLATLILLLCKQYSSGKVGNNQHHCPLLLPLCFHCRPLTGTSCTDSQRTLWPSGMRVKPGELAPHFSAACSFHRHQGRACTQGPLLCISLLICAPLSHPFHTENHEQK